jgi:hypothetical protein
MDNGFILLHRSIFKWEWWDNLNTTRLWITLLLLANWTETKWHGQTIMPGQAITSRSKLCKLSGLSENQVRHSLERLKTTSEITITATNKYSLVTIANWDKFQWPDEKTTSKTTSKTPFKPPANNQQSTNKDDIHYKTNKQGNKETSIVGASHFVPPTFSDVKDYCKERENSVDPQRFIDYYESNGWHVGKNAMKDWKAAVRNWEHGESSKSKRKSFYDLAMEEGNE